MVGKTKMNPCFVRLFCFPKIGNCHSELNNLNKLTIVTKVGRTRANMLHRIRTPSPHFELAITVSNFRKMRNGENRGKNTVSSSRTVLNRHLYLRMTPSPHKVNLIVQTFLSLLLLATAIGCLCAVHVMSTVYCLFRC